MLDDPLFGLRNALAESIGEMLGFGSEPEIADVVMRTLPGHPAALLRLAGLHEYVMNAAIDQYISDYSRPPAEVVVPLPVEGDADA